MNNRSSLAALVGASLLLGAGATAGASSAGSAAAPLGCAIEATRSGGMLTLEAVVRSDRTVAGSYRFRVAGGGGGGSTNIAQGGEFAAAPGAPASLGSVMLGSRGASYRATLEVTVGGRTLTCDERFGGAI